ncbi:MAG: hydrolase [Anaerolineae bacterium]|nr:hydrolase [Anaerolineae bacterium]MDW8173615.1 nitrilase-related carbon-nitrogen hydrolase [Anaerolineae bacterium]
MDKTRLALIQVAWTGSAEGMMEQYHQLGAQARQLGAQLVLLPEFSLLPYFPATRDLQGFQYAEPLRGGLSETFFSGLARENGFAVIGSLYERAEDGSYYDTATLHDSEGRFVGFTRKVHIPSGEGYHETDFFVGAQEYPVHLLAGLKLGAPTCYDQWFPELARIYALEGAELLAYPTAIGGEPNAPHFDSRDAWQTVMRGHAVANGLFVAACNRVGTERVTFYGSSFICDPLGRILAQASRDQAEVIVADLDPAVLDEMRELFPLLHQRRTSAYGRLLEGAVRASKPDWLA